MCVGLTSGAVTTTAPELPAPDPARNFVRELESLAARWHGVSGNEFKMLVLDQDRERERFSLRSWDLATGTANPPRELLAGRRLNVLPTMDGRFLLLRDADGPESGKAASWSVFSVATGERTARAPFEAGTQAAAVIGSRAYYLLSGPVRGPIHTTFVHPRSRCGRSISGRGRRSGNGRWKEKW